MTPDDPASRPGIAETLPPEGPALVQSLAADLRQRWRAGSPVAVEEYLARYPELATDPEATVELILAEFRLRHEHGDRPDPDGYTARFPTHADRLRERLRSRPAATHHQSSFQAAPGTTATNWERSYPTLPGYQIEGVLGTGGMAVVYRAHQGGLNRTVAVKMVLGGAHASAAERERFLVEAEVLASVQHPHIVQVHDFGTHDGQLYLVLEFCPGGSLSQRLDQGPLPPREAAGLVENLARAVHLAHERKVVHRDLKPANILLAADGTPKVTDFGLAKRVEAGPGLTVQGYPMGTPAYMPPEQAEGRFHEVGPAADVYALGAILYDCLTGRPPFQADTAMETLRQVREREPSPPRQLRPDLPRDLETVCLRCLAKEPGRRYASAEALADDLRRFLNGETVAARPVGRVERGWRWCRRNPVVAGLSVAVAVALLAGTALSTWQAVRASAAERQARDNEQEALRERDAKEEARQEAVATAAREAAQRRQAELVASLLESVFRGLDPHAATGELRGQMVARLEAVVATLDKDYAEEPLVRARLRNALGIAHLGLGEARRAVRLLEQSVEERRAVLGPDHPDTLTSMNNLAGAYRAAGQLDKVVPLLEQTQAGWEALQGPDHLDSLRGRQNLAEAYRFVGQYDRAARLFEQLLAKRKAVLGPDHPDTLVTMGSLGATLWGIGQPARGVELLRQALARQQALLGADDPTTLRTLTNLGATLQATGQVGEAVPLLEQARTKIQALFGPDHPETEHAVALLAEAYRATGDPARAVPLLEPMLARQEARWGPDHYEALRTANALATAYRAVGQLRKALPLFERTLTRRRALLGPDHLETLVSLGNLATAYSEAGDHARAVPMEEQALAGRQARLGPDHPETLTSQQNLALAYFRAGQLGRAGPLLEQSLERHRATLGADHPGTLRASSNLASLYIRADQVGRAIPLLEQALERLEALLGPDHPDTLSTVSNLAAAFYERREHDKAVPLMERALESWRARFGADHPETLTAMNNLGLTYLYAGQPARAVPLLQPVLARRRADRGPDHPEALAAQKNLAEAHLRAKQPDRALPLYDDLLARSRPHLQADPLQLSGLLAEVGDLLSTFGQPVRGEKLLRECLTIREARQPEAWTTFNARSMLGGALLGQQKYAEAEPLLVQGYEGLKARAETLPPLARGNLTDALQRLVQLYKAWGKEDEAAKWRKEIAARPAETPKP